MRRPNRDILELKAIQRSLPTAPQLPDPLARRPHTQILQGVRIGLLPMYDTHEGQNGTAVPVPPVYPSNYSNGYNYTSSSNLPTPELLPVPSRSPSIPPCTPSALAAAPSAAASPPPKNLYTVRPKPTFTFLPLLDAPPPPPPAADPETDTDSEHDLSTPALSNASLDTTPSPREHPAHDDGDSYFRLPLRAAAAAKAAADVHIYRDMHRDPPSPHYAAYAHPAPHAAYGCYAPPRAPFALYPPSVQFKRRPAPPVPAPSVPAPPPPKKAAEEESGCFVINGETFHFGPASTPPDSPAVSARDELDVDDEGLGGLSPLSPQDGVGLLPSFSRAPSIPPPASAPAPTPAPSIPASSTPTPAPAPSIPTPAPTIAPLLPPIPACGAAYDTSAPALAPFCMQMKRTRVAMRS